MFDFGSYVAKHWDGGLELKAEDEKIIKELEAELEETNAEAGRLRAIVAGKEALSDAEEKLRELLWYNSA